MFADLGLQAAALFLYPGALAVLVLGVVIEGLARLALREPGFLRVIRGPLSRLRPLPAATLGALLLAALAATQTGAPLSPVPDHEHSLLLGIGALAAATWLAWVLAGADVDHGRLLLVGQVAWFVAVLGPALATGTFHAQGVVTALLPLDTVTKAFAAVLYLLCLPAVLHLIPEGGYEASWRSLPWLRIGLWPPYVSLFASLFWTVGQDLTGIAEFVGASLVAAAITVLLAIGLRRRPAWQRRAYPIVLLALAAATLLVAFLGAYLP